MGNKESGKKVVYNACFGGFSLSIEAVRKLIECGNRVARDYGAAMEGWKKSEDTAILDSFGHHLDISRHDPDLIAVVEELGKQACGSFSDLRVVTLRGNRYRIDEYDGSESVVEPNEEEWTVIG